MSNCNNDNVLLQLESNRTQYGPGNIKGRTQPLLTSTTDQVNTEKISNINKGRKG